jgi:hypothetical protein
MWVKIMGSLFKYKNKAKKFNTCWRKLIDLNKIRLLTEPQTPQFHFSIYRKSSSTLNCFFMNPQSIKKNKALSLSLSLSPLNNRKIIKNGRGEIMIH